MSARVKFGADTTEFSRGVSSMQNQVKGLSAKLSSSIKSGFMGLGASLLAGFSLSSIKAAFDEFDKLGDLAKQVGDTPEAVQRLAMATKLAGTSVEALDGAFTAATTKVRRLKEGADEIDGEPTNKLAQGLKTLGINADEFTKANLSEQFRMVGEGTERLGNSTEAINALYLIFGNRVQELIPLLTNYRQAVKDMSETPVVSNEDIETVGKFNDILDKTALLFKKITVEAVLAGEKVSKWLSKTPDFRFLGALMAGQGIKESFQFAIKDQTGEKLQDNKEELELHKAKLDKEYALEKAAMLKVKMDNIQATEEASGFYEKSMKSANEQIAFDRLSLEQQIADVQKKHQDALAQAQRKQEESRRLFNMEMQEEAMAAAKESVELFKTASELGVKQLSLEQKRKEEKPEAKPEAMAAEMNYIGVITDSLRRVGGGGFAASGTLEIAKTTARNTERTAKAAEATLMALDKIANSRGGTFK